MQEGPFGEGWRVFALQTPDLAWLMESACKLALRGNGGFQYSGLWTLFPGAYRL